MGDTTLACIDLSTFPSVSRAGPTSVGHEAKKLTATWWTPAPDINQP